MKFKKAIRNYSVKNYSSEYLESVSRNKILNKVKYTDIISVESLKAGLSKTKSQIFTQLDSQVKIDFTEEKIKSLHKELVSQKYQPKPAKIISLTLSDGSKRPMGISSQKDKIVQAAILINLEPIVEQVFLDCSFGFRPERNCHNALKAIKTNWLNIIWFIKIDIASYFDKINNKILLEILQHFCDQATTELIAKFLNSYYIDMINLGDFIKRMSKGIPKGSILSPLLVNLYLHALDLMIYQKLLPEWNRGDEKKFLSQYQVQDNLIGKQKDLIHLNDFPGLEFMIDKLKENKCVNDVLAIKDLKDTLFRRLRYIRYADTLLLGFIGSANEAVIIANEIKSFITQILKLSIDQTQRDIFHSTLKKVKFLEFYLRYIPLNRIIKENKIIQENDLNTNEKNQQKELKSTHINVIRLRIPIVDLLTKAVERGYAKKREDQMSFRATSYRKLISLPHQDIVTHFSNIIKNIIQYYSPANQYSDLWPIISLYRKSCALTLAEKYNLKTAAAVYKRYGLFLKINDSLNSKKSIQLYYPDTLKSRGNFRIGKPYINTQLLIDD